MLDGSVWFELVDWLWGWCEAGNYPRIHSEALGGQQVSCVLPPRLVLPWSPVTDVCMGSDQKGWERHSPALQVEHKEGGLGGSGAAAGWPFALTCWPCVRPEALQVQSSAGSRARQVSHGCVLKDRIGAEPARGCSWLWSSLVIRTS